MATLFKSLVRPACTSIGGSPAFAKHGGWMTRALYGTDKYSPGNKGSKPDSKENRYPKKDRDSRPHRISRRDSADGDKTEKNSSESACRWDNRENRQRYNDRENLSYSSGRSDGRNRYNERDSKGKFERSENRENRGNVDDRRSRGMDLGDERKGGRNEERRRDGKERTQRKHPSQAPKAATATYERREPVYPRVGEEFVYGVGPVLAALRAGRRDIHKVYLYEKNMTPHENMGKQWQSILEEVQKKNLKPIPVAKGTLNMFADNGVHQGCALDVGPLKMVPISSPPELKKGAKRLPLWILLDQVTDPVNLGTALRSACFFGADGVAVSRNNSCPLTPVVSKVSAGAMELMDVHTVGDVVGWLKSCRSIGWRVVGTSIGDQAPQPLGKFRLDKPTIIVFGSEGAGIRPSVLRECSDEMGIFPSPNVDKSVMDSLNVSVCAGIVINHFMNNANLLIEWDDAKN